MGGLPPDPTLFAVPYFLLALALEPIVLRRLARAGRPLAGHERRDTLASLALGLGSVPIVGALNALTFALATVLFRHRLVDLGEGVLGWAVALLGWDLAFYWHHRLEHQNRLLWACHVNHHSSRHFNLSTALRQPWTPWPIIFFYAPLALLGVRPWMILVSGGLNLVYQFGIHTEAIRKLPWPFEAVLNTPSHHRVHHASDAPYLDRNFGGVLIVWDRLFGTFTPETIRPTYGLTKNIDTFHPLRIAFHEYAAIGRDLRAARGLRATLAILWHGPGWRG